MIIKCPQCQTENPSDSKFCKECATQLIPTKAPQVSKTLTLETQPEGLTRGTVFAGRYEILEALGTGGMGSVYRVYDRKLEEEVALKLIKPEIAANRKAIDRFKNELKVARKITHKSVCKMYDLGESGGTSYITMEYVTGEDLKSVIHRMGTITMGKAISITAQIAEGLSEAHRLGIIHRDLKPGNIMIDKEGNAKIMDFGIARSLAVEGITREGALIGTPEYMSPEQVDGKEADQRSDIYSLGIIFFEMLTGRAPFEGETPFSIANKHKTEPPPVPKKLVPQIPEGLNKLILRCLEKGREKRYQSAEELLADIGAVEAALPTAERIAPKRKTITHREVTVKFQPRRLVIPAAALIVIVAAALVFIRPLLRKKAAVAPKQENSIAVISFENLTGSSAYNDLIKAVPSLFITKFETMGFSYVATLERLRDLLKQMGKDPSAPIDTDAGFAACEREGIGAMVVGRITKAGNVFAIDIKVLDVATKKALASATSRGEGESSILMAQVDDLSAQIAQKLGSSAQIIASAQPISEVTTSSLEAYNYYLKGKEAWDSTYYDEARKYFLKAVEIDPSFAMAYRGLARVVLNLGLRKDSEEAAQKAMSLADRATPKEKLYIQGTYAWVEGDPKKNIEIYKELVEKYPREKEAHYVLGLAYSNLGDPNDLDKVIEEYQAAVDLDPDYGAALNNLSGAYLRKGDLGKAFEYVKRYVEVAPRDANAFDTLGYTYLRMGQLDSAIESFSKALSIKPDFFWTLRQINYVYGLEENYPEAVRWANEYVVRSTFPRFKAEGYMLKAFYEFWTGSFQKALDDAERFQVAGKETQSQAWLVNSLWLKAAIYRAQGKLNLSYDTYSEMYELAIKDLPDAADINRAAREQDLGSIEIDEGKIDAARKRLITLNQLLAANKNSDQKDWIEYSQKMLKAQVLVAEGSFAEAVSVLEGSWTSLLSWYLFAGIEPFTIFEEIIFCQPEKGLARAYEMKGDIDKAINVLERRTHFNAAAKDFRLTPPKFYYELGRLYEKKGLKEKARVNYAKFLSLWKDADPGQPEVEDAKKHLAGLT